MTENGSENTVVEQVIITVDGQKISPDIMDHLFQMRVESVVEMADMFEIVFRDDLLEHLDEGPFKVGKSIKVEFQTDAETFETVASGDITAIEPEYDDSYIAFLVVRGYDKTHRLNRGAVSRAFENVTDADIIKRVAGEVGLSAQVNASANVVREHVFQDNQTDLAFIHQLARRNGLRAYVENDTLKAVPYKTDRGSITYEWGKDLLRFHVQMSVAGQVDEVQVKGWDPKTKTAILGKAKSSKIHPDVNVGGSGGDVSKKAIGSAVEIEVRRPIASQGEADALAQSLLDEINSRFIEAEGVVLGNPKLVAGMKIKVDNLGKKFSGAYTVSTARHIYSTEGYQTEFYVTGTRPRLEAELIAGGSIKTIDADRWHGVFPAIVTDNDDPMDMGRVKVKYPWMNDKLASGWARIVMAGASSERGIHWLPEVNDEVLIAFAYGDINYPYILGYLYNGKDKEPEQSPVKNGKVEVRTIKTREGHVVRFTDELGQRKIEIEDVDGVNKMHLYTDVNDNLDGNPGIYIESNGTVHMTAADDFIESATGSVGMTSAQADMFITAMMGIEVMTTRNITLRARQGAVNIFALGPVIIASQGVVFEAKSPAGVLNMVAGGAITLEAAGEINIKGAIVNFNSPQVPPVPTPVQNPLPPIGPNFTFQL